VTISFIPKMLERLASVKKSEGSQNYQSYWRNSEKGW